MTPELAPNSKYRAVDVADDDAYWAGKIGTIYLLHFDRPVGTGRGPVQHYLGWALDVDARVARHRRGLSNSAALCRSAHRQGIAFRVVRTWPGKTRDDERAMKRAICRRYTLCPEPACREHTRALYQRDWQARKRRRALTPSGGSTV